MKYVLVSTLMFTLASSNLLAAGKCRTLPVVVLVAGVTSGFGALASGAALSTLQDPRNLVTACAFPDIESTCCVLAPNTTQVATPNNCTIPTSLVPIRCPSGTVAKCFIPSLGTFQDPGPYSPIQLQVAITKGLLISFSVIFGASFMYFMGVMVAGGSFHQSIISHFLYEQPPERPHEGASAPPLGALEQPMASAPPPEI